MALGGATGSVLRYLTTLLSNRFLGQAFPWGTLLANVIGCFIIGLLAERLAQGHHLRYLLITGFCGGYTTFSTFALENAAFLGTNQPASAFGYTLASMVLGLLSVWAGLGFRTWAG